jgi:hypothetical protein
MKFFILLISILSSHASADVLSVGQFSADSKAIPEPWEEIVLSKKIQRNRYQMKIWDGVPAIEVVSNSSMSLMARPVTVNLVTHPVLCWRWRIDAPLKRANLKEKAGDDFAARLYLSFRLPADSLSLAHKVKMKIARRLYGDHVPDAALNYVWDNIHPAGFETPNAYTEQNKMIVVRTADIDAGKWVEERRDILSDARRLLSNEQAALSHLAVTSDTDNTGENARAGFADLHFVPRDQLCQFSKREKE